MSDIDESTGAAEEWQAGISYLGHFLEQFLRSHPEDGERRLLEWMRSVPEDRTDAEYRQACERNLLTIDDLAPDVARVMPVACRFLCTHLHGASLLREWIASVNPVKEDDVPPDVVAISMRVTRLLPTILSRLRAGIGVREIASEFEFDETLIQSIADVQARKLKAAS